MTLFHAVILAAFLSGCVDKPPDELIEAPWCCRPIHIPQAIVHCRNPEKIIEIAYPPYLNDTGMDCLK